MKDLLLRLTTYNDVNVADSLLLLFAVESVLLRAELAFLDGVTQFADAGS